MAAKRDRVGSPRVSAPSKGRRSETIVLPIRPNYARLIYDGKKSIELRRRSPLRIPQWIFVYETSPLGRVTGWLEVERVEIVKPRTAWTRFARRIGAPSRVVRRYLAGATSAVLIYIRRASRLVRSISPQRLGLRSGTLQSFAYLSPSQVTRAFRAGLPFQRAAAPCRR